MENIKIVRPKRTDAKDIFRLQKEFDAYLQSLTKKKRKDHALKREKAFMRYGFGKNRLFYTLIAKKNRVAVGYICYHLGYDPDEMQGPVIHVIDIFVSSSARGHGIGKSLMKAVAEVCKRKGGFALYFAVWNKNKSAIKFYKKLGADWEREVPFMHWFLDGR